MLHLSLRSYARAFRQPLQTHHGLWTKREGLILRLQNERGQVGFGEVAPIPWFGTETLDEARAFCEQWSQRSFAAEAIATIPDTLPACQFGFASACPSGWNTAGQSQGLMPDSRPSALANSQVCALLPAGEAALGAWAELWHQGYRTFKWKISVASVAEEVTWLRALAQALPADARLRLDANGGLNPVAAEQWLKACDAAMEKVEFLEQPLPPDRVVDWILSIGGRFQTAIALDESVATLGQLQTVCKQLGNRVIYVVKPAIAGFPERLVTFCTQQRLDVVLSSALETPIGRRAALTLAQRLWAAGVPRALGFGVAHWFHDDWDSLNEGELWRSRCKLHH